MKSEITTTTIYITASTTIISNTTCAAAATTSTKTTTITTTTVTTTAATTTTSSVAYQMFVRSVEWNICSTVKAIQHNSQTHSARPVGQPGRSCRLPQPGQLTIGEELLGYHNNNNHNYYDYY